jgi:hypothetical protein
VASSAVMKKKFFSIDAKRYKAFFFFANAAVAKSKSALSLTSFVQVGQMLVCKTRAYPSNVGC